MLSGQQLYTQRELQEEDNRNLWTAQTHWTLKQLETFLLIIMQRYKHNKETSQVLIIITHPEIHQNQTL